MKNSLKIFLIIISFVDALVLDAQSRPIEIKGNVVDMIDNQSIEFATVMLSDRSTRKPIAGVTTDLEGYFHFKTEKINDTYIEVRFIGYQTLTIDELTIKNGIVDLGSIPILPDNKVMDEVVVRAERSQTEFKLDKRIFNVGKDLSSTGASALEVLNNVPSVNVNIEGEVSLRGSSGVQILINGKPSVMTSDEGGNALGTITADMIEKIEVITNPSAKYDAEGTSGIINIVIKKDDRRGTNGSVTLNIGNPHNHSFGLSLNRRTENFNLFSQLGVGYRELPNDVQNINRDLINGSKVLTNGEEFRNEQFYNVILGTDYHINENNVLTISGNFAYEIEDQPSNTNFRRLNETDSLISEWKRTEVTEATNPKYQYELQYKSEFNGNEDHTLLVSALGSFFGKDQSSDFTNETITGDEPDALQETRTDFQEAKYTYKIDYAQPISDKFSFETGAQLITQHVSNDFAVNDFVDDEWISDPLQTNIFEYDQDVFGVYGTGAYEGDKWGIKLGLRAEHTELNTLLKNTNESNDQSYTNLFPSGHTSLKVNDNFSLQAGYSRRIYRPRLWDLNPFFNIRNTFQIRVGNPELLPEFTDSYELSGIYTLGKTFLNVSVYRRNTTDVIERVSIFEDNVNTTTPVNVGSNNTTGLEINTKYSPVDMWTINGDFNFNYFKRQGALEGTSFDFDANRWSTKINNKFKLPWAIDFEITGHYRSQYETIQGRVNDVIFANLGARKKIMNGKGVINLSIRDVFASRVRENVADQEEFFVYNRRFRSRFVVLGFSYGFGKGQAMEFSGRKRF
ncbi:MAG TPA: TonB-dependent receptor domain-containing protein [Cyclobacteriaceae bacterium]